MERIVLLWKGQSDFSYGYNKKYGYIDTTGTAARFVMEMQCKRH